VRLEVLAVKVFVIGDIRFHGNTSQKTVLFKKGMFAGHGCLDLQLHKNV
jgi:hypothetical protein